MKNLYYLSVSILLSFVFAQCSIQKRQHLKGFNLTTHSIKKESKGVTPEQTRNYDDTENFYIEPMSSLSLYPFSETSDKVKITESRPLLIDTETPLDSEKKDKTVAVLSKIKASPNDSCDEIIFRNGEIVLGRILEISGSTVKYKSCKNLTGPEIIVQKNQVLVLRYSNGETDNFSTEDRTFQENEEILKAQKDKDQSILSLVLGSIGFASLITGLSLLLTDETASLILGLALFPLGFLATLFGRLVLRRNPSKESSNKAKIGLWLGVISLAGFIATATAIIFVNF